MYILFTNIFAFSLKGEAVDGVNCVRFGMVTAETDISELLSLVISTGREIETSSKFLDQMTDIVRKGGCRRDSATETGKLDYTYVLGEEWVKGICLIFFLFVDVYKCGK